jgi:REP element-mobilizing transposase RayT
MSRLPRLHAPGAIYHVTARGNHRQDIFFRRADRQALDEIMAHALQRTGARVHAYCWMTNHLHLLVQVGALPLGALMQQVESRFARFVQKGIPTTGHLFENRYHALLVDVDSYFLELIRYIHLNPVRAGIVDTADMYLWSSHRTYLGKVEQPWVETAFALRLFSDDLAKARLLYANFINEQVGALDSSDIRGHPKEPRVLGDDRFLDKLTIPILRRHPTTTFEQLVHDVCTEHGITIDHLRSSGRHHDASKARAHLAQRAIAQQVASLSEVARYLYRSVSALSRAVDRYRRSNEQT